MKRFAKYIVVAVLAACRGQTEKPSSATAVVQQATSGPTAADADSARAFVQRFYDWYLATEARKGSPYDSLLAGRRTVLGDSLGRAFQTDVATQRADTIAEIASLSAEADIFLNSQDPCPHYVAGRPRATGVGSYAVSVAGDCSGLNARPNIEVHVRAGQAGWHIENITDPTDRSFDLLGALLRYHIEQGKAGPQDAAGRDSSQSGTA
jgi:hypothetical protein